MNSFLKASVIFTFAMGFGWQFTAEVFSAHQTRLSASGNFPDHWRNPAAIGKGNDLSVLSGNALKKASQRRLLEDVRLVFTDKQFGIELGHFVVKGPEGNKQFACEYYDRVQITLVAEGVAVNGETPEIQIEGDCKISKDINRMEPVWLPFEEIKDMPPRNLRSYFFEKEKVFASVYHIGEFWPRSWRLEAVRVFNEVKSNREIAVESSASETYRSHPVTISW